MQKAFYYRKGIPFFYEKSAKEFQQDPYERYDAMVIRQCALHLADELWEGYPFQEIADWSSSIDRQYKSKRVVEIGCGVGRLSGYLASKKPNASYWGIDFSYQMLRQAQDFWVNQKNIDLDYSHRGLSKVHLKGHALTNLSFGLAKAEELPFDDQSFDFVFSSFLIDRVDQPAKALAEMYRILCPGGSLLLVSPLNFQRKAHWEMFFPADRLTKVLTDLGLNLNEQRQLIIHEPLDAQGNAIQWKCMGIHLTKGGN